MPGYDEDMSPSSAIELFGLSLIVTITSHIVEGSVFPLLNRVMIVGTCVLLRDIIRGTELHLSRYSHTVCTLPVLQVAMDPSKDDGTHVHQLTSNASESKHPTARKGSRDYRAMMFSKSLSVGDSQYIYDTSVGEIENVVPKVPASEKPDTSNQDTDQDLGGTTKAPWVQALDESLDKIMAANTHSPSTTVVQDVTYELDPFPSAPGITRTKSTFLEGTSQLPMMGSRGRSRAMLKRIASLPLRIGRRERMIVKNDRFVVETSDLIDRQDGIMEKGNGQAAEKDTSRRKSRAL